MSLNGVTTIHQLPQEVLGRIFQFLDLPECLIANKMCKCWAELVTRPHTILGRYLEERRQIEHLTSLAPKFSGWEQMPGHWDVSSVQELAFSSVCQDIIAFNPSITKQSSKFFSFTEEQVFSSRNILLGRCENTYFLIPQGPDLKANSQTKLKPLQQHNLTVMNVKDSTRDRKFSLLGDLPPTDENLKNHQITSCCPISEDKVAIVTRDGTISLWDVLPPRPTCYKVFNMGPRQFVLYKVGNHLIFQNKSIDLTTLSVVEHEVDMVRYPNCKAVNSCLGIWIDDGLLGYFVVNASGCLEKKWDFDVNIIFAEGASTDFARFVLESIDDHFIVISCYHEKGVHLFILNTQGELVHDIKEEFSGLEASKVWKYSIRAHTVGNILVYKHPMQHTIYFWHIPTKTCIQKFEWTKAIHDALLYFGEAQVQDVRFTEGKLTILLAPVYMPGRRISAQFRMIQFDPLNITSEGIRGVVSRISTAVKGLYYAFPG
jgi:hypothetical protein